MGLATILFVIAGIVAASRFVGIFRELGVALPSVTVWVLNPWFHVVVGAVLLGVCAGSLRSEWRSRAVRAWFVLLLVHAFVIIIGLFAPICLLIETLGRQAGQ